MVTEGEDKERRKEKEIKKNGSEDESKESRKRKQTKKAGGR
jgi:hypothetical protein